MVDRVEISKHTTVHTSVIPGVYAGPHMVGFKAFYLSDIAIE
jgi:hypothetical protein